MNAGERYQPFVFVYVLLICISELYQFVYRGGYSFSFHIANPRIRIPPII